MADHDHNSHDHSGHGHDHSAHMGHNPVASVVTTTVASILEGLQAHMAAGDHAGHMGYPSEDAINLKAAGMEHDHTMMDHGDGEHGDGGHGSTGDHGMGGHGMMMAFHAGYSETVLFESWSFNSVGGLIGSMVGIFFMAALYEGLKYYREYLFWRTYNALQYRSVTIPPEKGVVSEDNQIVHMVGEVIHKQPPTMFSWMHGFQTVLHILQIVLSYFLMLIFMTYNVWLCVAVVLGAAVGYFLFGWKKSVIVDVTEHCH